jgi:hypothetical protein
VARRGAPLADSCLTASMLRESPMIYPKLFLKHLKARRASANYPLYDVPNKQEERTLDELQVQENFEYFMRVRLDRLAFFQTWLREWFGVKATLDGEGLLALNAWINSYGGGLIGDQFDTAMVFATYQPAWVGEHVGYNVMIDIGIFVGEYLITKRPKLYWEIYRGHLDEDGDLTGSNLKRPHLGGFPRQWGRDALGLGYAVVATARQMSHLGYSRVTVEPDALIRKCKTSLHLANVPDNDQPYIFGDYSNEPI